MKFIGSEGVSFRIPYVLCDLTSRCALGFLSQNSSHDRELRVADFGKNYSFLTVIPILQNKFSGFGDKEPFYPFSFEVGTKKGEGGLGSLPDCSLSNNLYFGLRNSDQVRCLQNFLTSQDGVYPEGLVTGNFLSLTKNAVARFQEKYTADILAAFGLFKGTGFVGEKTRAKIQELLR